MFVKVPFSEINVAELNSDIVILITQFLRKGRAYDDFDLHMQEPGVLKKIVEYAEQCDDPDLIVLSMKIKTALIKHIKQISFPEAE